MSAAKRLGRRLKTLRVARGLGLNEFARLAKVPASSLSRYERGESEPNVSMVLRLAKGFAIAVGELLDGDTV